MISGGSREFGDLNGAVAVDLDERFTGWKLGITQSVEIKKAEVWELLDGVILETCLGIIDKISCMILRGKPWRDSFAKSY